MAYTKRDMWSKEYFILALVQLQRHSFDTTIYCISLRKKTMSPENVYLRYNAQFGASKISANTYSILLFPTFIDAVGAEITIICPEQNAENIQRKYMAWYDLDITAHPQ